MSRSRSTAWLPLILLGASCALLASGCGHAMTVSNARTRHAAQYGCAASDVEIQEISYNGWNNSGTFAAIGCGVRQVYWCDGSQCTGDGVPVRLDGAPALAVAGTAGGESCSPPCSPGYHCAAGVCQALCNPPCSPGHHCAQDRTCQADAPPTP
jgi:hypothetical protein